MTDRTYTEAKAQAPERVWLAHANTAREYDVPITQRVKPRDYPFPSVGYVRADVAQALVAAALREAAATAKEIADQYVGYMSRIERAILALITPDESAALDRIVQDAVKAETERCAKVADLYAEDVKHDEPWHVRRVAAAIRAGAGEGET